METFHLICNVSDILFYTDNTCNQWGQWSRHKTQYHLLLRTELRLVCLRASGDKVTSIIQPHIKLLNYAKFQSNFYSISIKHEALRGCQRYVILLCLFLDKYSTSSEWLEFSYSHLPTLASDGGAEHCNFILIWGEPCCAVQWWSYEKECWDGWLLLWWPQVCPSVWYPRSVVM